MAEGSVESEIKFEGYKVDRIELSTRPSLELIRFKGLLDPNGWNINIGFLQPQFYSKQSVYLGGINLDMQFYTPEMPAEDRADPSKGIIRINAKVVGAFSTSGSRLEKAIEDTLIKVSVPAIILPYLRGAVTTLFATAGFGYLEIPIVNIHALAAQNLKDTDIIVVDS